MYQVRCEAQVDHTYRHWIFLFLIQNPVQLYGRYLYNESVSELTEPFIHPLNGCQS